MEARGTNGSCTRGKRKIVKGVGDVSLAGSSRAKSSKLQKKSKNEIAPGWIGEVLQTNQLIVFRVFDHLSACDLEVAGKVCRFWRKCAQQARIRGPMIHQFSMVQLQGKRHFSRKRFGHDLIKNLRDCYAVPDLVMVFSTKQIVEDGTKYFDDFTGSEDEFGANIGKLRAANKLVYDSALSNHISTMLPPGSLFQLFSAWGLVTTEMTRGPVEYEICDGFAAICVSKFPRVKMHPFSIKEPKSVEYRPFSHRLLSMAGLTHLKDAKAVLAFSRAPPEDLSYASFLVDVLFETYPKLALAGAAVFSHGVLEPPGSASDDAELVRRFGGDPEAEVGLCGIVIEGDVQAKSIILGQGCRGIDMVKEEMSALKSFPVVRGRTIGFIFACCGRGSSFHGAANVESKAFGSLFPGVPLLGIFGNGEFGVNSSAEDPPNSMHSFRHTYTTAIMLITFNPPAEIDQKSK